MRKFVIAITALLFFGSMAFAELTKPPGGPPQPGLILPAPEPQPAFISVFGLPG